MLSFRHADADFPLFIGSAGGAVGARDVGVVLRVRFSHGAGFRCHAWEIAHCQGGFRLPESLHERDSCQFFPFVEHARVQSLACYGAIAQGREVVPLHILADEEAEHRGRRAERIDVVALHHVEQVGGVEVVEVVDEHLGSRQPLAIEFAPNGFSPPCVGQGEMQVARPEVMPVGCGDNVAEGIGEIVSHHFRFARCARREIKQHHVGVLVGHFRADERGCGRYSCVEIEPSFGHIRPGAYKPFHRFASRHGFVDMSGYNRVSGSHDHADVCAVAAVFYILGGEQMCGRDGYGAEFV